MRVLERVGSLAPATPFVTSLTRRPGWRLEGASDDGGVPVELTAGAGRTVLFLHPDVLVEVAP